MSDNMSDDANTSFFQALRRRLTILLVVGTLLVTLSSIGFWVQWTLMSERGFVELTGDVLRSNESRETIARAIVDQLFAERPILNALVRDPIEGLIIGILGSSLFAAGINIVSERIWETIFVDQARVVLDISALQAFLYGAITAISPDLAARFEPQDIPSELVLLDASELPNMSRIASIVAFTTWLTFFGGIVILAIAFSRVWAQSLLRNSLLVWTGILLIVEALILGILTIPTQSVIVVGIENSTGRTLIATTLGVLMLRLYAILIAMAIGGAVLIAVGFWKRRTLIAESTVTGDSEPDPLAAPSPSGAAAN